jgi:hypothetical protein
MVGLSHPIFFQFRTEFPTGASLRAGFPKRLKAVENRS